MAAPRRALSLVLVLLFASLGVGWSTREESFKIVGYLPEYRFGAVDWNGTIAGVSHLVLFSLEPTVDGKLGGLDRFPDPYVMRLAHTYAQTHGTRLMVSLGGAGRSTHFPEVALRKEKRRAFAKTVVSFCVKHGLHGVDLNWEYPRDENEWVGLGKLTRAISFALGKSRIENPEVFLAYHPGSEIVIKRLGILNHVNLAHAMAYDNARGGTEGHASLKYATQVLAEASSQFGRESFKKISLGVPFYGRGDGVSKPVGDAIAYGDIQFSESEGNSLDSLDRHHGYVFNGPATLREKVIRAKEAGKEAGAGGVTVWEVGQDVSGRLLRAVGMEAWPEGGHDFERGTRSELR